MGWLRWGEGCWGLLYYKMKSMSRYIHVIALLGVGPRLEFGRVHNN